MFTIVNNVVYQGDNEDWRTTINKLDQPQNGQPLGILHMSKDYASMVGRRYSLLFYVLSAKLTSQAEISVAHFSDNR